LDCSRIASASEQFYKPYSEETGQLIDREARNIVDEQYNRVKKLLTEKGELMTALADALAEKETLVFKELQDVLGERPYDMKQEYKKFVTAGANPFTVEMSPENHAEESAADEGKADSTSDTPVPPEETASTPKQPTA